MQSGIRVPWPHHPWMLFNYTAWCNVMQTAQSFTITDGGLSSLLLEPPIRPCGSIVQHLLDAVHLYTNTQNRQLAAVTPLVSNNAVSDDSVLLLRGSRVCATHVGLLLQWSKHQTVLSHATQRPVADSSPADLHSTPHATLVVVVHPDWLHQNFALVYIPGVHGSCLPEAVVAPGPDGKPAPSGGWVPIGDWARRGDKRDVGVDTELPASCAEQLVELLKQDESSMYLLPWTGMFTCGSRDSHTANGQDTNTSIARSRCCFVEVIITVAEVAKQMPSALPAEHTHSLPDTCSCCEGVTVGLPRLSTVVQVPVSMQAVQNAKRLTSMIPFAVSTRAMHTQLKQCATRQRIPFDVVQQALNARTTNRNVRSLLAAMFRKDYNLCNRILSSCDERPAD